MSYESVHGKYAFDEMHRRECERDERIAANRKELQSIASDADECLAMLKRCSLALRTIGILNGELGLKARAAALALADESAALIARIEKS